MAVIFRELEFESSVWPPTLAAVLSQVQAELPADRFALLRWAVTGVAGQRLRVEVVAEQL